MRILICSAALAMTAACVMAPPPESVPPAPPPAPVALAPMPMPMPPPTVPVVAAPVPAVAPVATAAPEPVMPNSFQSAPVAYLSSLTLPALRLIEPEAHRLTLTNISYDNARVQVLVTPYPDCIPHDGIVPAEFALPLNGSRILEAPPGSDVCWRREEFAGPGVASAPVGSGWTPWSRAYLSTGRSIDARL